MNPRRRLAGLAASLLVALAPSAEAFGDEEHEAAEAALARGDARPVDDLLQRVRANFGGSVLKIELEHEDEGGAPWVYEVKLLTSEGDVLELEYDAATLELIVLQGRYREHEDDD
jgi:uncharacterized membrane protein YkoI